MEMILASKRKKRVSSDWELAGMRLTGLEIFWGWHLGWGGGGEGSGEREHCAGRRCSSGELHREGCFAPGRGRTLFCRQLESSKVFYAGWCFRKSMLKWQGAGSASYACICGVHREILLLVSMYNISRKMYSRNWYQWLGLQRELSWGTVIERKQFSLYSFCTISGFFFHVFVLHFLKKNMY